MKTKTSIKRAHDETITVQGRDYVCEFQQRARGAYSVTCAALPSDFAYAADLAGARTAVCRAIEAVMAERERRYEESAADMI